MEEECIFKGDLEQTTVEEQSRIKQLEQELNAKKAKIELLQAQLVEPNHHTPEAEHSADQEHTANGQELDSLRSVVARQNQELSDLRQKIQQVNKENVDMMDSWKAKFDVLVVDHQRSLEELKATLRSEHRAPSGQEADAQELMASVESLKMEHQLEMENLKAKHKIEAAILSKEREDLSARLQEAQEQLENRVTAEDLKGQHSWKQALDEAQEKLQKAQHRLEEIQEEKERGEAELKTQLDHRSAELEALQQTHGQSLDTIRRLELELRERLEKLPDDNSHSADTVRRLEEELRVTTNQLQALQSQNCTAQDANVIEDHEITDEKVTLKQNIQETTEKLLKREKEVSALVSQVEALKSQITGLEGKVLSGEKKVELLLKEKKRMEAELDSMSRKSHDASGQLVSISQELLKKERSLNELRVLLLESHRPSREEREVCKSEWKVKEQKLQDDIKSLREKLLLLGQQRSSPDHRRYSMLDPSALDSEVTRLRQRLLSTEDALRNALEHNQSVDLLVQAMCKKPDKTQVHGAYSSNGIHHEQHTNKDEPVT